MAGPTGIDFATGKIVFALSGVAVLLAAFFAATEDRLARPILTVLGSWLAGAVIILAFAEFFSITSASTEFGRSEPAVAFGLVLTIIGGSIAAGGAVAGLAPGSTLAPPNRPV